jgi:serine/threonine protein kinase
VLEIVSAGPRPARMSDYASNTIIPGTVYQVVRLLGRGGMGTVYEVEDTTVGKRYVLKTLTAQLREKKEIAQRLNREARVLARLSHPNIVEVVTAGITTDGLRLPYFVMQKLSGHALRAVLNTKGCLPLDTAYSIAIDLLDALDHAHGLGVVHRDVKPENIFLHRGVNGVHQTKLLDFGVMRMITGDHPQTGGRFVGTLRYAPREQLEGGAITPQTDLYAAGLVLYEMIAGGGPFDDEITDRGIANAHIERVPPRLSSRLPIPAELDALVASALSKDPAARPADAFTFAAKLRDLAGDVMRATPTTTALRLETALEGVKPASPHDPRTATTNGAVSSHASKHARRSGLGFALTVGALLAVATVAALVMRYATSATRATSTAARTSPSAHAVPPLLPPTPTAPSVLLPASAAAAAPARPVLTKSPAVPSASGAPAR